MLQGFLVAADNGSLQHVHWNDSILADSSGRKDMHLAVGEGDLGDDFHAKILELGISGKATLLLEHWYDKQRLEKELAYIREIFNLQR